MNLLEPKGTNKTYLKCADGELSQLELSAIDNYCISPAIKFALKNLYGSILPSEYTLVLVRTSLQIFVSSTNTTYFYNISLKIESLFHCSTLIYFLISFIMNKRHRKQAF